MECCLRILTSSSVPCSKTVIYKIGDLKRRRGRNLLVKIEASSSSVNGSSSSPKAVRDMNRRISSVESLFSYDKAVPEQIIEKPVGLSLCEKNIGNKTRCPGCEAKGAILCATCSGSGLYVDSIMESQGIIVKVRCLGCGGSGNIMCSECGGRGHSGVA